MVQIITCVVDDSLIEKLAAEYKNMKIDFEALAVTKESLLSENLEKTLLISEENIVSDEWIRKLLLEKGESKVIIITNTLNSAKTRGFMLRGLEVHYKDSPIFSLVKKIKEDKTETRRQYYEETSASSSGKKYIAVTSPAGGVGKSTIALSLSVALAKKSQKVLLIDLSSYSDMAAKLRIQHKNSLYHIVSALLQGNASGEKLVNDIRENAYTVREKAYSFDMVYGLDAIQAEKIDGEVISRLIRLINLTDYDTVIFDTSSNINEAVLNLFEYMTFILRVSGPDISNGWKLIQEKELLDSLQLSEKMALVVNAYSNKAGFSCKQLEKELQIPLLGVVPFIPELESSINAGKFLSIFEDTYLIKFINYIAYQLIPVFSEDDVKLKRIRY